MAPRTSLCGFLTHAKSALRAAATSPAKLTLVIGNESADLDSMTSQIVFAYVRSLSPPKDAFTPLYIPVTNMRAAGVRVRPEFLAVFKHAGIEPAQLITLDDLPPLDQVEGVLRPEDTKWLLVDHNVLQGPLGRIYGRRVQGVIDHHDDEGEVPADCGSEPRVIERAGSCTSLVTNYCAAAWDAVVDDATRRWDADLARLALSSILIDTADLQDESKTTPHDRTAAAYLEAKITAVDASFNRTAFYTEIDTAKKDISQLPLSDILQKDYKQWTQPSGQTLGISSVVKDLSFLQAKAHDESHAPPATAFLTGVETFARDRNLDLYSIMTTSTSATGAFQRELLLWAFSPRAAAWAQHFAATAHEELGLEAWDDGEVARGEGEGWWRRVWWQRGVQHSRKRVAPLLRLAETETGA